MTANPKAIAPDTNAFKTMYLPATISLVILVDRKKQNHNSREGDEVPPGKQVDLGQNNQVDE